MASIPRLAPRRSGSTERAAGDFFNASLSCSWHGALCLIRMWEMMCRYRASEYLAAFEAMVAIFVVRAQLLCLPLRRVLALVVRPNVSRAQTVGSRADAERHVTNAIRRAAARLPFEANCLCLAIAAARLLSRRGIEANLHFGMRRELGALGGHAWLETDGRVIVDRGNARSQVVWIGEYEIPAGGTHSVGLRS